VVLWLQSQEKRWRLTPSRAAAPAGPMHKEQEMSPLGKTYVPYLFTAALFFIFSSIGLQETASAARKRPRADTSVASKPAGGSPPQPAGIQDALRSDCKAAVLMDALTGKVLYEQDAAVRIPPASFVKILTLYVAFDALAGGQLKMDDMATVSEKAWRTQGSKMFIEVGSRVRVEDLLKGIAVVSGNDACIALAEHLAGSEDVFVAKMNEKARRLGMKDSQFRNCHGMPADGQYVSALDMAILSRRYMEDHPGALAIHSMVEYEYNGIKQGNRNTLLTKNIGVDGLKTGHIEESGYHLAATAERDGRRMIAVIMGCDKVRKRAPEAQKLLEYGFRNFSTVEAVKKDALFGPVKVNWGKVDKVDLMATGDARVTVPKGKEKSVVAAPQLPDSVNAPLEKGQVLGKVVVQDEGRPVTEIPLAAAMDVEKSLIPPWPILVPVAAGVCLIGFGVLWWVGRSGGKRYGK